jgi:hypothetical protein
MTTAPSMTNKRQFFKVNIILLISLGLLSLSTAFAQRRGGMDGQMPMYDTKTETTLKGTVEETKTVSGMMRGRGPMDMQGTHLMLKTDKETIEVHLGPSAFLAEKKVEIAKGDAVEVTGSRVKIGESDALLAREIRKGETSWTLRDASGRPLWMMMGRR